MYYGLAISVISLALGSTGLYILRRYWRLRKFPGNFWARLTDLQRAHWVQAGTSHKEYRSLHEQYGAFVRMGPNMISISNPSLISIVYPMRRGLPKGQMYTALTPYSPRGSSQPLVFNCLNETLHMQMKKPVAPLFSVTSVLRSEGHINDILEVLFTQLDQRFAGKNVSFDLSEWLQYFAFDTMSLMTVSRSWGFLEKGWDHNGLLGSMWDFIKTAAPLTQVPWLDRFVYKNKIAAYLRPTGNMSLLHHVGQSIKARKALVEKSEADKDDFLSRFIKVQADDPSLPQWLVTAWTFSNIVAGSDSTSTMMKSLWYYLLSNPPSMARLHAELKEQTEGDTPYPKWADLARVPYLEACVNEAVRLRPPFGLPFERVVPPEGLVAGERFIPGGTVVGMNPCLVNRDKATFGPDADQWRPERWLVQGDRLRAMEQSLLTFGAGRRVCLGRNLALLELKKLTAALVLNYEIEISDPDSFQSDNRWLLRQWNLNVTIRRRE